MRVLKTSVVAICALPLLLFAVDVQQINIFKLARPADSKRAKLLFGKSPAAPEKKVLNEKASFPVSVKESGKYKFWIKFHTSKDKFTNLAVRIDAPTGEPIRYERIDYAHGLKSYMPYKEKRIVRPSGPMLYSFDIAFEYPGVYTVRTDTVSGAVWQKDRPPHQIESVWISNDTKFHPEKNPQISGSAAQISPPSGFIPAREHPLNIALNTGITDEKKRFKSTIHQNYPVFFNSALLIDTGCTFEQNNYGITDDKGTGLKGSHYLRQGPVRELAQKYPMPNAKKGETFIPVGRKANADGKYWNEWSFSFDEANESAYQQDLKEVQKLLHSPLNERTDSWAIAWEVGGTYDYGESSVKAYRKYLQDKYGTLEKLNSVWHTAYKSFEEIVPAKRDDCVGEKKLQDAFKRARETANFIDFREFCSREYAKVIARRVKASKSDPLKRPISTQFANLDLNAVEWSAWRPLDCEDLMRIGVKDADVFGYDVYGVDDWVGMEFDTFSSFGDDQKNLQIREGSTHTPDPYLAARTFWTAVGKGLKGFSHFMLQEGNNHAEFPKFGLTNFDQTPRPKLAAYSDAIRSVHHIEDLLMDSKRRHSSKPVAIYYSRTNNALQERSYGSLFDCGPDSPFRVYELIRGNGYPVTFITDTQIRDGKRLDEVSGIFFIDAKYIPVDVLEKVEEWVKKGGAVFADAQPGIYNGHGFPQDRFLKFLGIEPVTAKKVERLAADQNQYGYSAMSFDVVNADKLHKTQFEFFQQWDSPHPINRQLDKFMFSGFGYQKIKATAGEVIVMAHNGAPGAVIRNHGKGSSCYFAGYLGSIYGGAATHYEWRDAHSDPSPYRFIDAYLNYIGAKKTAFSDQEERIRNKMRFESPLVDAKGNAVLPMVSYNDEPLRPFRAEYRMPKDMKPPVCLYAQTNSNRKLIPLEFKRANEVLSFTMPSFRTFANVLALHNATPLLSLDFGTAKRSDAGLVEMNPGKTYAVKVTVYNPSPQALSAGKVVLRLPKGWFYDKEVAEVPSIPAYGKSGEMSFLIRTPDYCTATRFRPMNFLYENKDGRKSMPTVEMVWWKNSGN